MASFYLTN